MTTTSATIATVTSQGHARPTAEVVPTTATPGHTIGPFFHDAFAWANTPDGTGTPADAADHVLDTVTGTGALWIEGGVEDGGGEALPAWLIEAWVPQAVAAETAAGLPAPGFRRLPNGPGGRFGFHVPPPAPGQPAAFVTLFGLGLTRHHCTAVFLREGEGADVAGELLDAVPAERRHTLIATPLGGGRHAWTVRTQGPDETVFFDYR
ncbi:MAG: protocatechuate 3,4-dioxygenase [Oxalobacteraceae bacterium]|nr:MAG: protocatechuate 3,4-dioxygenase [Oxalobacteraceae bacterium]